MSKRKTTADKITGVEEQIKQLENQRKLLRQQERAEKDTERTHRLCKRGGLLEKLLPDTISLTDENFKAFFEKVLLSDSTRRTLDKFTAQNEKTAEPVQAEETKEVGEITVTVEEESEVTAF